MTEQTMTEIPTRDRMIAAAVTHFARAGFNGVTTKEISQSANVSDGNIYRYFPTKRDLFLCAFESELEKLSIRAEELARITNAAGSRSALRAGLELIATNMVKQPELVRLLHFSALEFKSDIEPMFRRHVYPIFEALSAHRKEEPRDSEGQHACDKRQTCANHESCEVSQMTTALFFTATVILLQDFFPSFSGCNSPFGSVESAVASYARALLPNEFEDANCQPANSVG
jgi:AcrR family transcriptional regulator